MMKEKIKKKTRRRRHNTHENFW